MYIYRLKCLYKAFVLYLNNFLKYYSLFIKSYKMYNSDLYFILIFLSKMPNQHNLLNIISLYFIFKVPCLHFTQKETYS